MDLELRDPGQNGVLVSAGDRYLFVADNNNNSAGGARKLYRFNLPCLAPVTDQ